MNSSLLKFKLFSGQLIIISAIIEMIFFFTPENIFSALALVAGWYILEKITLTSYNLKYYPVSFFMLLGLGTFYFLLPLPLTLIEFKPVTFNLRVPYLTFLHHFLFLVAIVFTHKIYTNISNKKNIFRPLLKKTIFYQEPSNKIIWTSALFGLLFSFYNYFIAGVWQMDSTDRSFMYYLSTIMSVYIWMPLVILFPKMRYHQTENSRKNIKLIAFYSIFVFIIAIASNWRTILFSGFFIILTLFAIGLLLQHYKLSSIISPKRLMLLIVAFFIVTGPLIDLAQAMVIVRGDRSQLSAVEFLGRTIDTFSDKDTLNAARNKFLYEKDSNPLSSNEWDENYLSNIVLNRMVNLKISDNSMYYADIIGYQNNEMQDEMKRQLVALIPSVLIPLIGADINDKLFASSHSIGDYLYSLAINSTNALGSSVISSMPGVGLTIFGYWYLLILIPMFFTIFMMFDSFVHISNQRTYYSYFYFITAIGIINYFNDRHVYTHEFNFIFRNYFESILIFIITMKFMKFITSIKI
nr:hypothetical protein [uncultured Rhodoferax sp.]